MSHESLEDYRHKFGGKEWWRQCGRKQAIFVEKEARIIAFVLSGERRFRLHGYSFHAYQCPWCEWWHLGHVKKLRKVAP